MRYFIASFHIYLLVGGCRKFDLLLSTIQKKIYITTGAQAGESTVYPYFVL